MTKFSVYTLWERLPYDAETGAVFEVEHANDVLKPLKDKKDFDANCECGHLASEHDEPVSDSPCRKCDCGNFRHK